MDVVVDVVGFEYDSEVWCFDIDFIVDMCLVFEEVVLDIRDRCFLCLCECRVFLIFSGLRVDDFELEFELSDVFGNLEMFDGDRCWGCGGCGDLFFFRVERMELLESLGFIFWY